MPVEIASFPEPWPLIFDLLGYAKEPQKLSARRKLPLSGVLKRKFNAADLCARIDTLAPLAHVTALEEIVLCGARLVRDLGPLAELRNLKSVVMWQTGIQNLEALREKNKLKLLHVWCSEIASLEPLTTTAALEELNVEFTKIESLEPLAALKKLRVLNISGTNVASLDALRDVPIANLLAYRTKLDARSLQEFEETHPACAIERGDHYPERHTRCGC